MAIKKLQNNFTTPEQSKRLLELGVPADSADCHYINSDRLREDNRGYIFVTATDGVDFNKPIIKRSKQKFYIPCWSVGRLIEIYISCIEHYTGDERLTFGKNTVRLGMIDCIIAAIKVGCNDGDMDFLKLED